MGLCSSESSISTSTIGEPDKLGLVVESHGDGDEADGEEDAPDDGGEQVYGHVTVGKYQPLRLLLFGEQVKQPSLGHNKTEEAGVWSPCEGGLALTADPASPLLFVTSRHPTGCMKPKFFLPHVSEDRRRVHCGSLSKHF